VTAEPSPPARVDQTAEPSPPARVDQLLQEARRRLGPRPTAADLTALRARGALIVDIRPAELRRRDGELPGAVVIDRNVLEWRLDPTSADRIPQVERDDQEIVLVCDEGYASSLAAVALRDLGLSRVTDLDGGVQAVLNHNPANREASRPTPTRTCGIMPRQC
jgi:rhodanese-related sulfurtransferase